ncbi:hypothetical protein [Planctobacterium marinum]|uniref:hypothetical protein n=1 Tax=Planctobacterium marinum TaxID=1631968 RepID=UPI001E4DF58A|nr:hypothetical protein [Planctobacterium marinum]MCC2607137.1 hypothetical protein [Planctobacterium marinum]
MFTYIIINVAGLLIPATCALFLSSGKTKREKFNSSIHAGVIGLIVVCLFQTQTQNITVLNKLTQLEDKNELDELAIVLSKYEESGFKDALRDLDKRMKSDIRKGILGEVYYPGKEETVNIWKTMFDGTNTSIDATNYISESFWREDTAFNSIQKSAHIDATSRGIAIRRIFIIDDQTNKELLGKLIYEQRQLGVLIRVIKKSQIENSDKYLNLKSQLGGSIDFVLFDTTSTLFVTHNQKKEISGSRLTVKRDPVDASRALFIHLWTIAQDSL